MLEVIENVENVESAQIVKNVEKEKIAESVQRAWQQKISISVSAFCIHKIAEKSLQTIRIC